MVDDKTANYLLINNGRYADIECTNNKGHKNNYGSFYRKQCIYYRENYTG